MNNKKSKFKLIWFSTINKIWDERKLSENFGLFLIFFQMIQLLSLILNDNNNLLLNYFSKDILFYFNFPVFYPFLKLFGSLTQLIIFFIIFFIITYVFIGFFIIYKIKRKKLSIYKSFINFYSISINFIDSTLIMPILGVLIRFIFCHESYKITQCYNFTYYIIFFFSLILIISFIFIEILVGLLFFNFNFKFKKDAFTRSTNTFHFIFKFYQVLVIILDIFIVNNKFSIIIIIHTIFSFIFALDYFSRLPYYNPTISNFYSYGIYIYLWNNFIFLVTNLIKIKLLIENLWFIIPLGSFFCIWISNTYKEYFFRSLITKDIKNIKNEIQLDIRIRYILNIIKNSKKSKKDELLMTSYLKVHFEKCVNIKCICKNKKLLYDPKKMSASSNENIFKDYVYIKSFMKKEINYCIKINNYSNLILLDYFNFLYSELHHIPLLNYEILNYEKKNEGDINIVYEYCLFRIKKKIKYLLKNKNKSNLVGRVEFEKIRKYDSYILDIKNIIIILTEKYTKFWDIWNDSGSNFFKIKEILWDIYSERDKILKIYNMLKINKNKSSEFFNLMLIFFKNILFDDIYIYELINIMEDFYFRNDKLINIDSSIEYINNLNLFEKDICCIEISMNIENIGKIIFSSSNIENCFLYEPNYLKNLQVEILMPKIIGNIHQEILKNFFKTFRYKNINNINNIWGIDKNGNLFKMKSIFKVFYYNNYFTVISLNQKIDSYNYLLTNNLGELDSLSYNFQTLLKLNQIYFQEKNNLNILIFIPKLIPLFLSSVFNIKNFKFKNYNYKELEKCLIMIPSNLTTIMNSLNSKLLECKLTKKDNFIEEYFKIIHKVLENIKYENIVKVILIKIEFKEIPIFNKIDIFEIKLVSHYEYKGFNKKIYESERLFLDYISFRNTIKISISNFKQQLKEKKSKKDLNLLYNNQNYMTESCLNKQQENINKLRKNKKLTLLKNTNEIENNNMLKNMWALKEKYENKSKTNNKIENNENNKEKPKKGIFVGLANLLIGGNLNKIKNPNNNSKIGKIVDKINSLKKGDEDNLVNLKLNILTDELLESKIKYEYFENLMEISNSFTSNKSEVNFSGKEEKIKWDIINNIKSEIVNRKNLIESENFSMSINNNIYNKYVNYCNEIKLFFSILKEGKTPKKLIISKFLIFFLLIIVFSTIISFYIIYKNRNKFLVEFNNDSKEIANIQSSILYLVNLKYIEKIESNNKLLNEILKFKPIIYNEFKTSFKTYLNNKINTKKNLEIFNNFFFKTHNWNIYNKNIDLQYLNFISNFINNYNTNFSFNNIEKIIENNYNFYDSLKNNISNFNKEYKRLILYQILGLLILFILVFFIFNLLIFNSYKIIQETLDLLTKIDKDFIMFYNLYFKKLFLIIKNIKNHKIDIKKFLTFEVNININIKNRKSLINKKKKISVNKFKYFLIFLKINTVCLLLIILLNSAKIIYLDNIKNHNIFYLENQFLPCFLNKFFISTNRIINEPTNINYYKDRTINTINQNIKGLNKIGYFYFSNSYKNYLNSLLNKNNCDLIKDYPCTIISNIIFKNSFISYLSNQNFIINLFNKNSNNLNSSEINNIIENQYLFYWYFRINNNFIDNWRIDINNFILKIENIDMYLMIVILILFFILAMITIFYFLKKIENNLKNGFKYILLLPYKSYKKNQYFAIFFKKRLKIIKLI